MRRGTTAVLGALASAVAWSVMLMGAQTVTRETFDVAAHYDKREVMIPMRDGVKLFTIIYSPKDTSQPYPIMLARTAYGIAPYGPDRFRAFVGPSVEFSKEGYIFVYQGGDAARVQVRPRRVPCDAADPEVSAGRPSRP